MAARDRRRGVACCPRRPDTYGGRPVAGGAGGRLRRGAAEAAGSRDGRHRTGTAAGCRTAHAPGSRRSRGRRDAGVDGRSRRPSTRSRRSPRTSTIRGSARVLHRSDEKPARTSSPRHNADANKLPFSSLSRCPAADGQRDAGLAGAERAGAHAIGRTCSCRAIGNRAVARLRRHRLVHADGRRAAQGAAVDTLSLGPVRNTARVWVNGIQRYSTWTGIGFGRGPPPPAPAAAGAARAVHRRQHAAAGGACRARRSRPGRAARDEARHACRLGR